MYTILPISPVHSDQRRDIFEAMLERTTNRASVLVVKEPADLGNHYHKELTETFLLVSGKATLLLKEVNNPGSLERAELVESPVAITIYPYTAHLFKFTEPGIMICLSDRPFDKDDLIPFQLQ